jgi:tRNA (cmo5U34)-methyltransferase
MKKQTIKGNFDKKPTVQVEYYDKSIRYFCGAYEEIFNLTYCCLKANVDEKAKILIVGAGSGMEISLFSPLSPKWELTGVDPSGDMLNIAQKKINDNKLENEIKLIRGYVEKLEKAEIFDGATCILVMHFLDEEAQKLKLLKSIYQRLKPGSSFVLVDGFGDPGDAEFQETLKVWKQYPLMKGVKENIVEKTFNDVIGEMVHFIPEKQIRNLLKAAGFKKICKFYTGFCYGGWLAFKE